MMPPASSWLAAALALVSGAILGVLFTIAHRAGLELAGVEVPVGLGLGLVAVAALLTGLRLLSPDRLPVVGAAIGITGAIMLLAAGGDSARVLITNGPVGLTWLIAPSVIAAVVILWPARRAAHSSSVDSSESVRR